MDDALLLGDGAGEERFVYPTVFAGDAGGSGTPPEGLKQSLPPPPPPPPSGPCVVVAWCGGTAARYLRAAAGDLGVLGCLGLPGGILGEDGGGGG